MDSFRLIEKKIRKKKNVTCVSTNIFFDEFTSVYIIIF